MLRVRFRFCMVVAGRWIPVAHTLHRIGGALPAQCLNYFYICLNSHLHFFSKSII
jgi:hypothetical protein